MPPSILQRGKQGFEAPIGEWLRGPLAPMADALLADGRQDHRHRLWSLVMLELWFRQFADGSAVKPRSVDAAA